MTHDAARIAECEELRPLAGSLQAGGLHTVDELWTAVGSNRLKGIPELARKCNINETELIAALTRLAAADLKTGETSRLKRWWADAAAVTVVAVALLAIGYVLVQRPVIPEVVVVGAAGVGAFDFVDSSDIVLKRAWRARTAFYRLEDVVGRFTLVPLAPNARVLPSQLGQGRFPRELLSGRTVFSLSIGADQAALPLRAGQEVGILLSPKAGDSMGVAPFNATVLHVARDQNTTLILAVPPAAAQQAMSAIARSDARVFIQNFGNRR